MAGEVQTTQSNPLAGIAALLQTLGGTQTTTNAGNTDALQQVLAGLQGQDFNALLQGIFSRAGGQIPGMQAAYGNAVGARSGNNSAVQAALSKLMQDTALQGQQQIANQQAQNYATQANVAGNIAQATRGTQQQSGTNMTQAGGLLAAMQALSMLTSKDKQTGTSPWDSVKEGIGNLFGAEQAAPAAQPVLQQGSPVTSGGISGGGLLGTQQPVFMSDPFSGNAVTPQASGGSSSNGSFPTFSYNPNFTFDNAFSSPSAPVVGSGMYGMDFSGGGVDFGVGSGLENLFSSDFTSNWW